MTWVVLLLIVALIAAAPVIAEWRRKPMDGATRNDAPGQFIDATDGTTHVCLRGPVRGPMIVCVHGLTTSEYVWTDIADQLIESGYRVLTYDLFGRGYSDRPAQKQDEAFFLRQLNDLLTATKVPDSFTLMGYSMGASIAVAFAADKPDRVDQLILLAPAGLSDTATGYERFVRDTPVIGDWLVRVFGGIARHRRRNGPEETDAKKAEFARKQLAESEYRGFLPAVLSSARHMLRRNQSDKHRRLEDERVTALAIWGEQDTVIPLMALGDMTQANRSVIHDTVEGADHGLPYTHPDEVVGLIKPFLLKH